MNIVQVTMMNVQKSIKEKKDQLEKINFRLKNFLGKIEHSLKESDSIVLCEDDTENGMPFELEKNFSIQDESKKWQQSAP